jgi:hypothetical protein
MLSDFRADESRNNNNKQKSDNVKHALRKLVFNRLANFTSSQSSVQRLLSTPDNR